MSSAPQQSGVLAPRLDLGGTTPYDDYIRASVLSGLQQTRTEDPGEMAFIVTSQVMELWFTLLVHEWQTASAALADDDLPTALAALHRSLDELAALNASWQPLAQLTPTQFNAYRPALGDGSGFQSAMYRRLEFLLGERSASMLVPHTGTPQMHTELQQALHEPSLYDEVLHLLHRRGHQIPQTVLNRDLAHRYESNPTVEQTWADIYATPDHNPDLIHLGEALTNVAEAMWRWRGDHLMATRRAMGAKVGTGGSAGVAWLAKRAETLVFPELWTARSRV
ncbi:tryptophan 2,3-dioxygenase [Catenulispora rubra]|uniref:tryptophan 2,3-dioxygenase n=1 Tax=Catenulispora rubra TaxID=280293 RepID=UPI001892335A|nr:tryptophan 2,3-dioxygenase family protein [Catenulispora rubra]